MTSTAPPLESNIARAQVLAQLDAILSSPSFAPSKRCQEFLRYVIRESMEGRADSIKERTIALEVFGKSANFESGEDSLVRVKAREVRKRLAEYYESAPNSRIRIDMPVGSYVPRIQWAPPTADPHPPIEKKLVSRRKFILLLGAPLAMAGAASMVFNLDRHSSPLNRFWKPILDTKQPLIIFLPILPMNGKLSDRVGIGPTVAVSRAVAYLTKLHYPYRLQFGADLSFSELRQQPTLLLGGLSSTWTQQMMQGLRFNLGYRDNRAVVIDAHDNQVWLPVGVRENGYADQDFGIVCRLLDSSSGQIIVVAAGTTTFGTQSAAELLFSPTLFPQLLTKAPSDWETRNFQAVIHTTIIGITPGPPNVVATYFW